MHILIQLPQQITGKKMRWSIAALLFFLCILIGVGWAVTEQQPTRFTGKNSLPVNATIEGQNIQFSAEAVQPELRGENYFVNYRLQREQTRQEEKTMLAAVLDSNLETTKEEAQKKWLELSSRIGKEDEIENLLKIKGFQDVIADLTPDSANVVIFAQSLSPNELSTIQDITLRVTTVRLDRINISMRS